MFCRSVTLFLFLFNVFLSIQVLGNDSLTHKPSPLKSSDLSNASYSKNKRTFNALLPKTEVGPLAHPSFFLDEYVTPVTVDQAEVRSKIEATYLKVIEENRFIEFLDLTSIVDLPVGIRTDLGVMRYTILIDSIVMRPTESLLYASMVFETPHGKKIHFLGGDIKFSKSGGLTGDGKLLLVGDYPINLNGDNTKLIISGKQNKTFVEFDCNGYKQLSLDGSLIFSNRLLVPEDTKGVRDEKGNVAIDFTTTIVDWDDILVNVNVPKFQLTDLKGITFSVNDAVVDFSDTRNAASVKFPEGYEHISPQLLDGNVNLWQGVYLRQVTVTLPPQFETRDSQGQDTPGTGHRISFQGADLVIDNVGFSGRVSGNNLIPIDKGKIGNWKFSLERIYVVIVANEIREGGFEGKINIPISKIEPQPATPQKPGTQPTPPEIPNGLFVYRAIIKTGNDYIFTVTNPGKLKFDLWKADVTINPSSYVEIKLSDGKFLPKAHLNGSMTMNLGMQNGEASADSSKNVKLAMVRFESLEIQSVKPYVKVGFFSLGTEGGKSGLGGFPITINQISGTSAGDNITLGIDLTLSLVGETDGGFAATGKINLLAEGIENNGDLSYRFKEIQFERFGINIDKGAFKFKGTLNIYKEDAVYGNGISGTVDATFNPGITLSASAIFGTKNGIRYWYVDALGQFKSGLTIFTGLACYGFGGGAYYHMRIDDKGVGSPLGKTVSGIVYIPDETVSLGLKATVAIGLQPGQNAFNGDATFEMAFHKGGGVKYINFRGTGYFMSVPAPATPADLKVKTGKLATVAKRTGNGNLNEGSQAVAEEINGTPAEAAARAQVWASLIVNYDFDNRILHGNLSAYVNVAGGLIKGAGPQGRAGEAVLHFAPGEWYIYIGRPEYENRFAIEVLGLARLDAYFVMGTVIPGSPPPPDNVSQILGGMDLDYMKDLNALGGGAGVGFGASFSVDTGDKSFLIFYGRFTAGLGFDIMLKDYGETQCKDGGKLGINGWYANGQAYAYFEGQIGIKVKIFGKKKQISILEVGAAVVAQAMMPNPIWVRGIAGGNFSVLGGLVKGNCKFEIEIGRKCEIIKKGDVNSALESVDVIAQVTPSDNAQQVDVFTLPQAVFNYEMEKEYEMVDDNDQIVRFKISLDEFTIKDGASPVVAEMKWNDDKTVAALNPFEILPSEKELTLNVVTAFKEKKGGVWTVTTVDGQPLKETKAAKFKTDKAPDFIPENNIASSYPSINQFNYYKNETTTGYVVLKQGQSYLFNRPEWDQVIRFKPYIGSKVELPFSYDANAKEVRFSVAQNLNNDQLYEMSLINLPKGGSQKIDTNVDTVSTMMATSDPDMGLSMRTREAEGTISEAQEKLLYSSHFRSSKYNTLKDKITSVNPSYPGWRDPILEGIHMIGVNIGGTEPFSYEEIYGSSTFAPLVQLEADLTNVPWYTNEIYPLVYSDYPLMGKLKFTRDPNVYGFVPTKSVVIYQIPFDFALTPAVIEGGSVPVSAAGGRIDYYLAYFIYEDYSDLRNAAANYVIQTGTNPARLDKLINTRYPYIKKGDYPVNVKYVLPGKGTVSSTNKLRVFNPME